MHELLKGAPVASAIGEKIVADVEALKEKGTVPTLAILRVGERADDLSYERGAMKKCAALGVYVKSIALSQDITEDDFFSELKKLNDDKNIHGILMLRPLPRHIDDEKARALLSPEKDVDGCTYGSLAGVFANEKKGFPPCTAQAIIEMLDYYKIECEGKKAAVIGRSLVVGRPVSMMLMHKNATVTTCHTKTLNTPEITKQADIVVVCAGKMETIGKEYFKNGAVVIDAGIGWNEEKGKLCGDCIFDEVEPLAGAITPVPGGVGAVTTAVLVSHVVEAAKRSAGF